MLHHYIRHDCLSLLVKGFLFTKINPLFTGYLFHVPVAIEIDDKPELYFLAYHEIMIYGGSGHILDQM